MESEIVSTIHTHRLIVSHESQMVVRQTMKILSDHMESSNLVLVQINILVSYHIFIADMTISDRLSRVIRYLI